MVEGTQMTAERRVLRLLSRGQARIEPTADGDSVLLNAGERGSIAILGHAIQDLARRGLITIAGEIVAVTAAGRHANEVRRDELRQRQDSAGNQEILLAQIDAPEGGAIVVPVNLAESPLAMLARRRGRDGKPFLAEAEWRAGERFRADYTRGQIMPRLGANWEATVSSGRRADGGGVVELTDAALAARFRVEKAIGAVGPELSGVLIDVCCFLKGLELVETEHGWPVRSAKVMLKAALAALARHYNPGAGSGRKPAHPLHWGAEGYRPKMMGGQ